MCPYLRDLPVSFLIDSRDVGMLGLFPDLLLALGRHRRKRSTGVEARVNVEARDARQQGIHGIHGMQLDGMAFWQLWS